MKKRLDILVYEKGFTDSREKAKTIIMSGQVYVDNQKADKCGTSYDVNVKDYDLQVLRDKVSIALQKPEIFSTTIAENIAWGDDSADIEKIRQAVQCLRIQRYLYLMMLQVHLI